MFLLLKRDIKFIIRTSYDMFRTNLKYFLRKRQREREKFGITVSKNLYKILKYNNFFSCFLNFMITLILGFESDSENIY